MLSGFNHNLKHRGKTFHIQTEDGGKDNPQIITHAFLGGVILDTVRTSYGDLLEKPNWQDALRGRMKAQHLEEIRKLFSGAFDEQTGTPPEDD
ncbi:MAG: hypothetical protein C3F14_08130 [Deltaproteobacteria bacterium]|nr:MAG: hypothetical protein C3F14_08130 [Deltaproteobacteria bacterium]